MRPQYVVVLMLCLLVTVNLVAQEPGLMVFSTQTNNGPLKDWISKKITYIESTNALTITAELDSTVVPPTYMRIVLTKYKGVGAYTLTGGTSWRYGARTDQLFTNQSGSATVDRIDTITNRVYGTFSWYGNATLTNGTTLTCRVSGGQFNVLVKPTLAQTMYSKSGVKLKPEETIDIALKTLNKATGKAVKGVTVAINPIASPFEVAPPPSIVSNDTGGVKFTVKVKKDAPNGDYQIFFRSTKEGFEDSQQDTFKFKVTNAGRYWYSKCESLPLIEFDAGDGEKWSEIKESPKLETTSNKVKINGLLSFAGVMRIDTSGGGQYIDGNGRFFFDVMLGDKPMGDLYNGDFRILLPKCVDFLDFSDLPILSKIAGGKIKTLKFKILGDYGGSFGGQLVVDIEGPKNTSEGCNSKEFAVWKPNANTTFGLDIAVIQDVNGIIFNGKGSLKNLGIGSTICMKEISISYESRKDSLVIAAKAKSPLFEEASLSVSIQKQEWIGLELGLKTAECIPIPETPLCWKGGSIKYNRTTDWSAASASMSGLFSVIKSDKLLEFELTAKVSYPPFVIAGTATTRMLNGSFLSPTKPWQIEGSRTFSFDLDNRIIKDSGSTSLFHLGGDWFFVGTSSQSVSFPDAIGVTGRISGAAKIPAVAGDLIPKMGLLGRAINAYAPFSFGTVTGVIEIFEPGKKAASITYDLSNATLSTDPDFNAFMQSWGKGTLTLDFDALPSPTALKLEGGFTQLAKFFGGTMEGGKGGEAPQLDKSITVPANSKRLIIAASRTEGGIVTSLTSPSGTMYTKTTSADKVVRVVIPDGTAALWSVVDPAPGMWKFTTNGTSATDSIEAYGSDPEPTFVLNASQTGRTLNVTWTTTNVPAGASVDVFVDDNGANYDGAMVTKADASANAITIQLADTTAPCSFHVYGILRTPTWYKEAYAEGSFANPRTRLLAPQGAHAVANQQGLTTVAWTNSPDPETEGYVVHAMVQGADSVLAVAYGGDTSITFDASGMVITSLYVVAMDINGRLGCPGAPISIVTDVAEERAVISGDADMAMTIAPQPATDRARISLATAHARIVDIDIVDATGRVVMSIGRGLVIDGTTDRTVDLGAIPTGAYLLVVRSDAAVITRQFLVLH